MSGKVAACGGDRQHALRVTPRRLSGRGLAYWTDGRQERIVYVTPGYRMIALDATTGRPISTFGKNGTVDLKLEDAISGGTYSGELLALTLPK